MSSTVRPVSDNSLLIGLCTLELNAFKKRQVAIKQKKRVAEQIRKVQSGLDLKAICTAKIC